DAFCPASRSGKLLQKRILNNLLLADKIACVSQSTLDYLMDFAAEKKIDKKRWQVIHCAFNGNFYPLDKDRTEVLLRKAGIPHEPYLLHVGSNLQRKNRKMLIDMISSLDAKWKGNICYAGDPADNDLLDYAAELGVKKRIISAAKPDHDTLLALYSGCEALIYPSFS